MKKTEYYVIILLVLISLCFFSYKYNGDIYQIFLNGLFLLFNSFILGYIFTKFIYPQKKEKFSLMFWQLFFYAFILLAFIVDELLLLN